MAGSHLGPWLMPRTFMDNEAKWFPEGALEDLPDIESERSAYEIIGWELEPGDAVFFNMLTLHCAGGVEGPHRRRVLSLRYLGDDVTHAPRPWTTSPNFPGLADELDAGVPMDHPLFPVVWNRRLAAVVATGEALGRSDRLPRMAVDETTRMTHDTTEAKLALARGAERRGGTADGRGGRGEAACARQAARA